MNVRLVLKSRAKRKHIIQLRGKDEVQSLNENRLAGHLKGSINLL